MDFISANGISMAVAIHRRANAPAVVFSNSLAADMEMWHPQAEALADGFTAIRFDARGHGATEATPGDYSLELLGSDVLALLDELKIDKVHFVGLSLGGMVGQWLGVNAPNRLKSLTLCATFNLAPYDMWNQRIETVRKSGIGAIVEPTLERWLTEPFRVSHPRQTQAVRDMILRTSVDGYAGSAAAIRDMNIKDYLGRINLPTLLVAAELDPSSPPSTMRQMHEQARNSEYREIAGAAHVFTIEKPEESAEIIGDFLKRIEGALQ